MICNEMTPLLKLLDRRIIKPLITLNALLDKYIFALRNIDSLNREEDNEDSSKVDTSWSSSRLNI